MREKQVTKMCPSSSALIYLLPILFHDSCIFSVYHFCPYPLSSQFASHTQNMHSTNLSNPCSMFLLSLGELNVTVNGFHLNSYPLKILLQLSQCPLQKGTQNHRITFTGHHLLPIGFNILFHSYCSGRLI